MANEYHWDYNRKIKVNSFLMVGCSAHFVGICETGTSSAKISDEDMKNSDIIIGYCNYKSLYVVWNAYLHRGSSSVSVSFNDCNESEEISSRICSRKDGKRNYEKQLFVPEDKIEHFCKHWLEYLMPSDEEFKKNEKIVWADKTHPKPINWEEYCKEAFKLQSLLNIDEDDDCLEKRERITSSRYERDPYFRSLVIGKYNNKCAVCRCSVPELLEAAHIKAVKDGGNDSKRNGICLCRNHHKAFDSDLLKLDFDRNEFAFIDKSLQDDDFSKIITGKYSNKLLVPID